MLNKETDMDNFKTLESLDPTLTTSYLLLALSRLRDDNEFKNDVARILSTPNLDKEALERIREKLGEILDPKELESTIESLMDKAVRDKAWDFISKTSYFKGYGVLLKRTGEIREKIEKLNG